jgi:hypothetical protein
MPLYSSNYRLKTNPNEYDWMQNNIPEDAANYAPSSGNTDFLGSIGQGAASGAIGGSALGPWGTIGGGLLGAAGAGLQAYQEEQAKKQAQANLDREFAYKKQQDEQQQGNVNRTMGMNAIAGMKDDFKTALYRALTRG